MEAIAYRCKPRVLLRAALLRAMDGHDLSVPIDIFQAQPRHFAGPQSIERQQHQDGMGANVGSAVTIAAGEEPLHFLPACTLR